MSIDEKFLSEYAYLNENAYLNSCSVAMPPKRTVDFMNHFMTEFTETLGELCFGPYEERRMELRRRLASLIGASSEDIVLTHNTTEGDCLLMYSYPLQAGDSVVLSGFDYPSVILGWFRKQKDGITVKNVEAENGCVRAEDLISAIDETTKVVAVSWVQYMSGYRLDLEKLGEACYQKGVILLVDAIQGLGRLSVDVRKCHIGILSCGGFKGLLGPLGSAFFYCAPELQDRLTPQAFSEDNLEVDDALLPVMDEIDQIPYRPGAQKFQAGSVNNIGLLALSESVGLLLEIGQEEIESHCIALDRYFCEQLKERNLPLTLLGDPDLRYHSGTVCVKFDPVKIPELEEALQKEKIFVTVRPVRDYAMLRFSVHFYVKQEDIDRLLDTLQNVFSVY